MQLRFKSGIRLTSKLAGFFTIVLIIIALSFISRAQTAVTGGLSGTVTDSTGAVVPNASVTIVNTATGTRTPALCAVERHWQRYRAGRGGGQSFQSFLQFLS